MLSRNMLAMDLIKIPLATVIFIAAAYMLLMRNDLLSGPMGTIGAIICIGALVYSITLYTNININFK